MQDRPKKYLNHTKEDIEAFLIKFKGLVKNKIFIIAQNEKRMANREILQRYHINNKKQQEMLLSIQVSDFCYSVDNEKNLNERLYIFLKEYELDNWGILEKVTLYIKIVIKKDGYTVIISFHEPTKLVRKLFI